MNLYYHHVGVEGAAEDFPKTVFTKRAIGTVSDHVSGSTFEKPLILEEIGRAFPDGRFNCWGVPEGAKSVVKNLQAGDAVLLIVTTGEDGAIPALCRVKAYYPLKLYGLSKALWGSEQYPYIFFFDTTVLSLTWGEFLYHVDYKPNYDPRGKFLSVADWRLSDFGGAEGYINLLLDNFREDKAPTTYSVTPDSTGDSGEIAEGRADYEVSDIEKEFESIITRSVQQKPNLTDEKEKQVVKSQKTPRSEAFRSTIRRLYDFRCSVCGLRLFSPDGNPEVHSAHIYPKRLAGSDDLRNGISLCRLHHWAFDAGWFSLSDEAEIIVRNSIPSDSDYEVVKRHEGSKITSPDQKAFVPHPVFLRAHRKLYNFE